MADKREKAAIAILHWQNQHLAYAFVGWQERAWWVALARPLLSILKDLPEDCFRSPLQQGGTTQSASREDPELSLASDLRGAALLQGPRRQAPQARLGRGLLAQPVPWLGLPRLAVPCTVRAPLPSPPPAAPAQRRPRPLISTCRCPFLQGTDRQAQQASCSRGLLAQPVPWVGLLRVAVQRRVGPGQPPSASDLRQQQRWGRSLALVVSCWHAAGAWSPTAASWQQRWPSGATSASPRRWRDGRTARRECLRPLPEEQQLPNAPTAPP